MLKRLLCQALALLLQKYTAKEFVLCGIEARICILQSALQYIQASRVVISNTESLLVHWLGDAVHNAFKNVSALVK